MGHKVHPNGFRLGGIRDWQTHWYAPKADAYRALLQEDIKIRRLILARHRDAGVSKVEIERKASEVRATIHSARPGVVIGRGGQRVEELRRDLETATGKRVRVDIQEIRQPELEATLVAQSIAEQMERQVSFRRALKQSVARSMQAGCQGIRVMVAGRLGGAEIARREKAMAGRVPLHTLRADIDFGRAEARTKMGQIGVKVWIYRGQILPPVRSPAAEVRPIEATAPVTSETPAPRTQEGSHAPAETR